MMVDASLLTAFISLGATLYLGLYEEKRGKERDSALQEKLRYYDEALISIERLFDKTDAGLISLKEQMSRPGQEQAMATQARSENEFFNNITRSRGR